MADLAGFNANEVEPASEWEPVPAGQYVAVITASEMKATKAGTGRYLELTLQIVDGAYQGRLLWSRINLENPNATAVEMGRAELSAVCRAVGVMTPRDSAELHDIPMLVTVKVKKRDDTGDFTNEIRGYAPKASAVPATPTSGGAPWKRS
ncbi:MAG: DUF669 domain-containing protein [Candidatus Eisenbacteria bacterium]